MTGNCFKQAKARLRSRNLTRSKFHTEKPQILGTTLKTRSPCQPGAQDMCTTAVPYHSETRYTVEYHRREMAVSGTWLSVEGHIYTYDSAV